MNFENKKNPSGIASGNTDSAFVYEINLFDLAHVLISKLWIIVLAGLVAAIAAYFYTVNFVTPMYRSTARVYILNRQNTNSTSVSDLTSAASIKEDFIVLVKSNEISRQVLNAVGEDSSKFGALKTQVSLDNNTSRFVDITVSDSDPLRAKRLADAFANVCRTRAKELMGVEDITIEEYGTIATSPSSPSMSKNMILAAVIGIFISAAAIVLFQVFNTNISSAEDIEHKVGLCVLGTIPDATALRKLRRPNKNISSDVNSTTTK